ncbi:DNA glycosylase [Echria macrotheca]|uniref:DNA-(apurinic or apyrimidinic site) lyase n=1 Tax=Echria macrotheca TaxID=438768 RepID=A0AAJ0BJZ3_9PEZI|nr:DNA glycosylase [Echria macrotheca]
MAEWRKLPMSLAELCIDTTLRCGQSFRWKKINDEWHCVLQGRILSLKQDPAHLHYKVTWPSTKPAAAAAAPPSPAVVKPESSAASSARPLGGDNTEALIRSYFALSQSLSTLYEQWTASDANFARRAPAFTGIRILNQDAWEALVAFICSSNNNISRISQMVHKLCLHYGPYIGTLHGEPFHDFPRPDALSGTKVESHLRELGFGYRAKYIADTARIVATQRPDNWLRSLRNPDCPALQDVDDGNKQPGADDQPPPPPPPPTYRAAQEALLELSGVGPKVADCVCLMGLGWGEAVPVDTHVWQIAQRDYSFGKGGKTKTFSKAMYDAVGDHFRKIWGPQAGWAQSVLFTANLKSFAEQASGARKGGSGSPAKVKVEVEESTAVVSGARAKKRKATTVAVADIPVVKPEQQGNRVDVLVETKVDLEVSRTKSKRVTSVKIERLAKVDSDNLPEIVEEVNGRRRSKRIKSS